MPAAMLMSVLFSLHYFQAKGSPEAGPSAPLYRIFGEVLKKAKAEEIRVKDAAGERAEAEQQKAQAAQSRLPDDPVRNHMKPRVMVKRVASRMGSTMIYQRSWHKVPVTVVWVFPQKGYSPPT